ncbi:MAG: glycosyltransferase family 2 protein, partial [Bacteroidales bacterium]|nr:glycosyltransferase family 2 protein [Bacteroidales bacterium]
MKTAVVILNYNTRDYLKQFLPGLLASCEGLDAEVVVADNASADGSVELMQTEFPQVPLIRLEENFGFTGGYNRALAQVDADCFVLINSDIEVPRGWLKPLMDWMESHPECGACGPKLLSYRERDTFEYAGAAGGLLDRYGYPFCRGRIMQKVEKDHGQYDVPANVLWCSGACLMVRASVWRNLGGLDDRFFAHMEEIDLCWRMQLAGWKVTLVPESYVYHIGGGTLPNESPFKLRLNFRNN